MRAFLPRASGLLALTPHLGLIPSRYLGTYFFLSHGYIIFHSMAAP